MRPKTIDEKQAAAERLGYLQFSPTECAAALDMDTSELSGDDDLWGAFVAGRLRCQEEFRAVVVKQAMEGDRQAMKMLQSISEASRQAFQCLPDDEGEEGQ